MHAWSWRRTAARSCSTSTDPTIASWRVWPPRCGRCPGVEVLFSGVRGAPVVDGTFPLELLQVGGPLAPHLLVTLAWSDERNDHGYPGISYELGSNQASHGGASAWENTEYADPPGPWDRRRHAVLAAVGNVDLAPTVLSMLGLPAPESMTRRVLQEAWIGSGPEASARVWEGSSESTGTLRWSEVGGARYLSVASLVASGPQEPRYTGCQAASEGIGQFTREPVCCTSFDLAARRSP